MDVFSLNYKQLQSEAKKHGIKANQKIDILRLRIKEALNNSSNNVELNSVIIASTPFTQHSRTSISNLDMSSSEDIDKILDSNRRNSQFFDDILNFPNNENINLSISDVIKNNSKEIIQSNTYQDKDVNTHEYKNATSKKIRKLNITFEMDDNDKMESQITDEQRKVVSVYETGNSCGKKDDRVFRRTPTCQKNYLIVNHERFHKINRANFLDHQNLPHPKQYKPTNKCIALDKNSKSIKPSENSRKSNFVSNNFSVNRIYQKKIARPSLLPISKASRNTLCGQSKKII